MKYIITLLIVLSLSACASSRGFDRGELRSSINEQKVVTEDDIKKALEARPQLPSPFRLAVYFVPPKYDRWGDNSWSWQGEDKDKLLEIGKELQSKNIVTDVIVLNDAILDGTDNRSIRLAAARAGADAVMVVNGVSAIDRYNNAYGVSYVLLVTPFFVPGTVVDGLFMVNATMWDVRNQYLYLSSEAEGAASETNSAFQSESKRVIKAAKKEAMAILSKELSARLISMGKK